MKEIAYLLLNHLHSIIRWLLLSGLVTTLILAVSSMAAKRTLSPAGRIISGITVRIAHTQLLVGLILYIISPRVVFKADSMSSPILRFFLVEHAPAMFISIILITLGHALMKKSWDTPRSVYKVFWFYLISLIIILAMIPWPFMPYGSRWI